MLVAGDDESARRAGADAVHRDCGAACRCGGLEADEGVLHRDRHEPVDPRRGRLPVRGAAAGGEKDLLGQRIIPAERVYEIELGLIQGEGFTNTGIAEDALLTGCPIGSVARIVLCAVGIELIVK